MALKAGPLNILMASDGFLRPAEGYLFLAVHQRDGPLLTHLVRLVRPALVGLAALIQRHLARFGTDRLARTPILVSALRARFSAAIRAVIDLIAELVPALLAGDKSVINPFRH